jgi:hydrogenase maturation protease
MGMILLIAYGNSLRRDDEAGLVLAERLEQDLLTRQVKVERLVVQQLTPELALQVARDEVTAVIFADTRASSRDEIAPTLQLYPVNADSLSPSLGHHLDAAMVLTYARLLYGKQPPAWVVTVPGVDFGHGEGLSQVAQQALNTAPDLLMELLIRLHSA